MSGDGRKLDIQGDIDPTIPVLTAGRYRRPRLPKLDFALAPRREEKAE